MTGLGVCRKWLPGTRLPRVIAHEEVVLTQTWGALYIHLPLDQTPKVPRSSFLDLLVSIFITFTFNVTLKIFPKLSNTAFFG